MDSTRSLILVVDDDPVYRMLLASMLEGDGFEVMQAASGSEALTTVSAARPDLVVIDALMPGLSGFETITALRGDVELATTPVIVVSGLHDVGSRLQALAVGADDFMTKTGQPAEFLARVRAQLRIAEAWSGRVHSMVDAFESGRPVDDRELAEWLDCVIRTRAFTFAFQPVVDLRSGEIVAQEALARFDDGTSPLRVLEVATALDRRVELELALLDEAVDAARELPPGRIVHLNASPLTALSPDLPPVIERADRGVVLEITENGQLSTEDAGKLRASLPTWCRLAADDVGAGFAGLYQLLAFRPDIVKIDRAVITGIDQDPARQALVAGLVQFAKTTDAVVIAEGIERHEEAAALLSLGVPIGQGYHLGRPAVLATTSASTPVVDIDLNLMG